LRSGPIAQANGDYTAILDSNIGLTGSLATAIKKLATTNDHIKVSHDADLSAHRHERRRKPHFDPPFRHIE
jgi:hypothetical protein